MKSTIIIGTFIVTVIGNIISAKPETPVIATVNMDGIGHYRLTNYQIDSNKCIHFIDFTNQHVKYCGAYEITDYQQLHELELQNYKLSQ